MYEKIVFITTFIFVFGLALPISSFAQGTMGNITSTNNVTLQNNDGHTAREEAEEKEIWEKLQAEELKCENLTDENFGALGEYFMGQMMGDSHESMNNMMIQMMGEAGEEEVHVTLGKRMSGCEPNAAMPQNMMNSGMMQMMMGGGMMGNWSNSSALNNFNNPMSMMNFGFAPFGWLFMILFWILVIAGIVALIKWIAGQNRADIRTDKSALDILKERYAKGEINKKEFEEKKKDLD